MSAFQSLNTMAICLWESIIGFHCAGSVLSSGSCVTDYPVLCLWLDSYKGVCLDSIMNAYRNQKFGFVMQAKEPDVGFPSYAVQ